MTKQIKYNTEAKYKTAENGCSAVSQCGQTLNKMPPGHNNQNKNQ